MFNCVNITTSTTQTEQDNMTKYESQVKANHGSWIAVVTYEGQVREFRNYASQKAAEKAAARLLAKYI
jgi:hypothetical protein